MAVNELKTMPVTLDGVIALCREQEGRCRDIVLAKDRTWLNPDLTLSSIPKVEGKEGMTLLPLAAKQLVRTVVGMDSRTLDFFKEKGPKGLQHLSNVYNEFSPDSSGQNLKVKLYTNGTPAAYSVVSESYREFPGSQIGETLKQTVREWMTNPDIIGVGIDNLTGNGRFGQTVILPWETRMVIPMGEFNGPRGDRYVYGVYVANKGDGTGSLVLEAFLFRVQCANGMTFTEFSKRISITHRGRSAYRNMERGIRNAVSSIALAANTFQQKIGVLPSVELENPFAALVTVAEKDLGERRVQTARDILSKYVREMGSTAEAVVNTITDIGTRDSVESIRETAQGLGGRILGMTGEQWLRAEARGHDVLERRAATR